MRTRNDTLRQVALMVGAGSVTVLIASPAWSEEATPIALLSAQMQNDHQEWIPTTDAERQRIAKASETFKSMLEQSGKYRFIPVGTGIQAKIGKDQKMGECAGCEVRYGKELGAKQVAWINVQKVSELILNMNVYITDVETGKPAFEKSVDLRGNTDESWRHSMTYLVRHYLLPEEQKKAGAQN